MQIGKDSSAKPCQGCAVQFNHVDFPVKGSRGEFPVSAKTRIIYNQVYFKFPGKFLGGKKGRKPAYTIFPREIHRNNLDFRKNRCFVRRLPIRSLQTSNFHFSTFSLSVFRLFVFNFAFDCFELFPVPGKKPYLTACVFFVSCNLPGKFSAHAGTCPCDNRNFSHSGIIA